MKFLTTGQTKYDLLIGSIHMKFPMTGKTKYDLLIGLIHMKFSPNRTRKKWPYKTGVLLK